MNLSNLGIVQLLNSKKFTTAVIAIVVEVLTLAGAPGGVVANIEILAASIIAIAITLLATQSRKDVAEIGNGDNPS